MMKKNCVFVRVEEKKGERIIELQRKFWTQEGAYQRAKQVNQNFPNDPQFMAYPGRVK